MRLRCVVPGCRHTRGDRKGDPIRPGMEWICGEHWRLVSPSLKLARRRLRARAQRGRIRSPYSLWRIWSRMKRQAIEKAAGIA